MKLAQNPNCQLRSLGTTDTFIHMLWECPAISLFWSTVTSRLFEVLGITMPFSPVILLLNDFTGLKHQCWFLVSLTAAKTIIAQRWKSTHTLSYQQWVSSVADLANLEMSMAHKHGANEINISL